MSESASRVRRKLTTIMAADAAGYSTAMDADEVGTLEELRSRARSSPGSSSGMRAG